MRHARSRLVVCALVLGCSNVALGKPYKGGEVYSTQTYSYGRMEMRMRMAIGSGILSTFFTYKNGSEMDNTFWEEIDIEVFGKDGAVAWQSNIITGQGTRATSEEIHTHPFSLANGYHTYALEWTPDHVAWEIDGVVVRETTGSQVEALENPHSLRFNIWAANDEGWVGPFDTESLPQYQFVNWISYYRYENGEFVHAWTDDFDAWDGGRWQRADWTFAENLADFDPNNVTVQNGTLVLALTAEGQTGFSGTVPFDDGTTETGPIGSGGSDGVGGSPASGGAASSGGSTGAGGNVPIDSSTGGAGGSPVQGAGGELPETSSGGMPGSPAIPGGATLPPGKDGCSIRPGSMNKNGRSHGVLLALIALAFTCRRKSSWLGIRGRGFEDASDSHP